MDGKRKVDRSANGASRPGWPFGLEQLFWGVLPNEFGDPRAAGG